jgi:N-acetylglucosamine malate deacetylase 2
MQELAPLLGRTLVIVAHADDEAVACGALLQRMREPHVVFCTDSAPRDDYFWRAYGARDAYKEVRYLEAAQAMDAAGVRDWSWLVAHDRSLFVDQELFLSIDNAMRCLRNVAAHARSEAILTLAYEGGHPDHDTCNFLGRQLANELDVPVWEAPLYHRARSPEIKVQQFIATSGSEVRVTLTGEELACKRATFAAYESQRETLASFDPRVETVRPMVAYDYSRPPHEGALNYEAWGWSIRGWQICDQFRQYLNTEHEATRRSVA